MKQTYEYKEKKPFSFFSFGIVLLVLIAIVAGAFLYYNSLISPVSAQGQEKIVEIPKGYSLKNIARLLEEEGIIREDFAFQIAVRLDKKQSNLQSGKYLLSSSMTTKEVIDIITQGKAINDGIKVTIPEGYNINMIAEKFEEQGLTTKEKFLEEAQNIDKYEYSFLNDIPKERDNPLEGYLFPDTYEFPKDVSEETIIKTMLARFDEIFTEEYYERAKALNMSVDDIVILASIIEQETKHDEDRSMVAGVFYNRLEKNMHLQSDVTVLYALGVKKEQVLYKDTEVDSKYNTYKYTGLPIGPIGSFGKKSLVATLYPEDNDYYYFIAKPDGYCVFNETYEEHMVDVNKYLR